MIQDDLFLATLKVADLKKIFSELLNSELPKHLPPPKDELNTKAETCIKLRCSIPTLNRYETLGYLERTQLGTRKVFFRDSEINKALKSIKRYARSRTA